MLAADHGYAKENRIMLRRISILVSAIFLVYSVAVYAVSELPIAEDNEYLLSADGASWFLQFAKADFELLQSKFRNEGRSRYFHFSDKSGLNVSFFIEPASSCRTSVECRKMQHDKPSASMKAARYVKDYEINGFAVVEYFLEKPGDDLIAQFPALKGKVINQGNINAHYVREGYWVDVHISKLNFSDADRLRFKKTIESLAFVKR